MSIVESLLRKMHQKDIETRPIKTPETQGSNLQPELGEKHYWRLKIGGVSPAKLEEMLIKDGVRIAKNTHDMICSPEFRTLEKAEEIDLKLLRTKDLGFRGSATTFEIYKKAQKKYDYCIGLDALHLRLAYRDQPPDERLSVGMIPVTGKDGELKVFALANRQSENVLYSDYADLLDRWEPEAGFVFRMRKPA